MTVTVLIASEFALPPAIEARWLDCLPPARRLQLCAWPDGRERHRSLLGSRLLADGLRRLGHPAGALASLRYAPGGRPTLDLEVDFSISHCEGRVLCALSTRGTVGVDVEPVGSVTARHFARYLTPSERAWAGGSPRRFCEVWTRKEAVAKAGGSAGLAAVPAVRTTPGTGLATYAGRPWFTPALAVGRRHVAHLALAERSPGIAVHRVSREALERGLAHEAHAADAADAVEDAAARGSGTR